MAITRLDDILDTLNRFHQRTTYGALAGLLGKVPRSVMQGRPKDRRHSWVVSKATSMPTDYPVSMVHPAIKERPRVLTTTPELEAWLSNPS